MDNLEEMDRFLEKFNLPGRSIETLIKNLPKKQKPRTRWLHRRVLSDIQRRANDYPSKTLAKYCRGRNTSKLILQGHHHPDTKTRQRQHKKENLIAKFRLKLKKVGKTTRPFSYDLNQIPYYYTVEVTNRFKGLDLIECLKNHGQRFVTLYRRQGGRPSPQKRNA